MKTREMFDKMEAALPYVAEILNDEDTAAARKEVISLAKELKAGEAILRMFPVIVTKHRDAMYNIIAITENMDVKDVPDMDSESAKAAIKSSVMSEMLDFFPYVLQTVMKS